MFSVSAIPRGPVLGRVPVSGMPGDRVNVSCSVLGSLPAPSLTWSVVTLSRLWTLPELDNSCVLCKNQDKRIWHLLLKLNDSQKIRLLSWTIFFKRLRYFYHNILCLKVHQQEPSAGGDQPPVRRLLPELPRGGDEADQQLGQGDPGHRDEPLLHPPRSPLQSECPVQQWGTRPI